MEAAAPRKPANYKSRYLTDGRRLYEVDLHTRSCVFLRDIGNGELVSVIYKDFFSMEIVRPEDYVPDA